MEKKLIDLIEKYNQKGHYYTSYPTEPNWFDNFSNKTYVSALEDLIIKNEPLSLYVHFPFCPKQCFYCFCRTNIAPNSEKTKEFLEYNLKEINLLKNIFDKHSYKPNFKEVHLGGGSPSFMKEKFFDEFIDNLGLIVDIKNLEELRMEIDPRTVDEKKLIYFNEKGVKGISFGVQDSNFEVQKAVNRVQPLKSIEKLLDKTRNRFKGINFDLIFGLPLQTRESFKKTIEEVKSLSPDRISLYSYDHKPEINKHQKLINKSDLPNDNEKILIFRDSIKNLSENGYELIGIDHFAKKDDDLAKSVKNKTITRNFNGYSFRSSNLIGIGPTGSGRFLDYYAQNVFSLSEYYEILSENRLPISNGYKLNKNDLIRRSVIDSIICYHNLDFKEIEKEHKINFKDYFKKELKSLNKFVEDGVLKLKGDILKTSFLGNIFIPQICRVFDKYDNNE